MNTVGELKEFIKNLPDEMLIVNYHSDMETYGYTNNIICTVSNMKKERRESWDRFDNTDFSYEVYVKSEDGIPCLTLRCHL